MAQFDVYRLGPLAVVDLQSDIIRLDRTRLIAPLRIEGENEYFPKLTPRVQFDGQEYVAHVHDIATVRSHQLGDKVGSIDEHGDDLLRAIDILTRGF